MFCLQRTWRFWPKPWNTEPVLATDDYALQNVALHLGLKIEPIGQPRIKRKLKHVQRCQGCGKRFEGEACPDCGSPARKKKRCNEMKNIESLIKKATELKAKGLVEGHISEELNVSSDTVTWLLTHARNRALLPVLRISQWTGR